MGYLDSNQRMPVSKTGAVTTWLHPNNLVEGGGFEPPGASLRLLISSQVQSASLTTFHIWRWDGESNPNVAD
mgnify:CR=1 FL=1